MQISRKRTILIIDDDTLFCDAIAEYFRSSMNVFTAHTGKGGVKICSEKRIDLVLLDQNLPDCEGYTLCPSILTYNEQTKIIFISAHPSFENAVNAVKSGAYDYMSKPLELEELSLTIDNALKTLVLEKAAQIESYKIQMKGEDAVLTGKGFSEILGLIERAAAADAPILITGETGTGKNVIAKEVHYRSSSAKEAFISINCAALPENLIEAELFGYEKGAFTGATSTRKGVFEMAEGGTLFLDEIGEIPLHLQAKLLSVLEDKRIKRLGGETIRPVDVRIIAATNAEIENVLGKSFRADLYYRLSVVRIHIPPLRERREDIPQLCSFFLKKLEPAGGLSIAEGELEKLMAYDWPGNVRELRNVMERACILKKEGELRPSEIILRSQAAGSPAPCKPTTDDAIIPLHEVERKHILAIYHRLSENLSRTSLALEISLSTLKRKLKEYGVK
ncbi:MAG: sigma-54-dependent Fis family transcriptional regulator [Nitrospirales bacterium]|nr:sigma-54-dependent Fis family transcriptional regulator [Nitrospirales bacterium]